MPVLMIDKKIYVIPLPWVILTLTIQVLAIIALVAGLRQTGITSFLGMRQAFLPEDTPLHAWSQMGCIATSATRFTQPGWFLSGCCLS